jgi:hypothetical protein
LGSTPVAAHRRLPSLASRSNGSVAPVLQRLFMGKAFDMIQVIPFAVCASIALCLLIDTSGWWLRTFSDGSNIGHFVSRTNLYTYSGRLFSFLYMSLLSLYIEIGANTSDVCVIVLTSFMSGAAAHKLFLNRGRFSQKLIYQIARLMRLDVSGVIHVEGQITPSYGEKLRWTTAASTMIFCLGMSAPYILASLFPQFRLTLASVGQILNAVGMMFILFFVDFLMYKSWDNRELSSAISFYNSGRIIGILCAAGVVLIIYLVVRRADF